MTALKQYDLVRICQILRPPHDYDGWRLNKHTPQVGEVGTLVDILQAPGLPDHYVVECTASDGGTVWLSEFLAEELEPDDT